MKTEEQRKKANRTAFSLCANNNEAPGASHDAIAVIARSAVGPMKGPDIMAVEK